MKIKNIINARNMPNFSGCVYHINVQNNITVASTIIICNALIQYMTNSSSVFYGDTEVLGSIKDDHMRSNIRKK